MHPIYNKMKIFHYPTKLRSLSRNCTEILPPIHVRIKPTNVCNHRCSYCAYRVDDLQLGQDMEVRDQIPRDKMTEIAEDLIQMGVKAVTFSGGGEPLLYPHLAEVVEKLTDGKVSVGSLSNGSRLSGKVSEVLAHRATWVRVSIDGWDDESYAAYRNVAKGEFTRVIGNIEAFVKRNGSCYVGVSMIVDSRNAPQIFALAKVMAEIGVKSFKVSPCIVSNDLEKNNSYHQPLYALVKSEVERCMASLHSPSFEVSDEYHHQLGSFEKNYSWCPFQQILPVIGADLNVYSCQDKAYNLDTGCLGSIKSCCFSEFWQASKETFFKINPSAHCNHHCVANGKNLLLLEYLAADPAHLGFV